MFKGGAREHGCVKFGNTASLARTGRLVLAHSRSSTLYFALNTFNENSNWDSTATVRFYLRLVKSKRSVISVLTTVQKEYILHREYTVFGVIFGREAGRRPIILSHICNACKQAQHRCGRGWGEWGCVSSSLQYWAADKTVHFSISSGAVSHSSHLFAAAKWENATLQNRCLFHSENLKMPLEEL